MNLIHVMVLGYVKKHEVADGTVCSNKETECMYANKCLVGQCILGLPKPKGESCSNSSAGPCNHPDTCNGQGSCQANLVPDMTECKPGKGVCDPANVASLVFVWRFLLLREMLAVAILLESVTYKTLAMVKEHVLTESWMLVLCAIPLPWNVIS